MEDLEPKATAVAEPVNERNESLGRLKKEKAGVDAKLIVLAKYTVGEEFKTKEEHTKSLLRRQLATLQQYANILGDLIATY